MKIKKRNKCIKNKKKFFNFIRHSSSTSEYPHFTNAIVAGEQVAKGTQPWVGVIGTARFRDSANGGNIFELCIVNNFNFIS